MLNINLKKKRINTQNSHYFLYFCILFSSKFLENYYLLNYLAKKLQKKKKHIKYCCITIQYLLSSFFYFRKLFLVLKKKYCCHLYINKIKNNLTKQKVLNKIILYFNDRIHKFFINIIILPNSRIRQDNNINKKNFLKFNNFYSKRIRNKFIINQIFQTSSSQSAFLNYNQLLKISNQYKSIYKLRKKYHYLRFGTSCKENNENSFYIPLLKQFQINFLNSISVSRLFKLKKIYLQKKNINEIPNFKEIQLYIIYFFKKLFKKTFLRFKFKKSKNIFFQEISDKVKKKNSIYLNIIQFDIRNSVTLKDIKKINRNLNEIFTLIVKFCVTKLNLFARIYFKFFLIIKSENENILFVFTKNKPANSTKNFQLLQYKILSSWQFRKNIYNSSLVIKFILKHLNLFFLFNITIQIIEVINYTLVLYYSVSKHTQKIEKINMLLNKKICFFILRLFILEKLLFYDNFKIKNITHLKNRIFEKDQISEKKHYVKKMFALEKTLNKIYGKLNCPNNSIKNEIISRLYKKINCPVIKNSPKEVILYKCGHLFSSKCVKNLIISRNRKCPLCGKIFSNEDIRQAFLF